MNSKHIATTVSFSLLMALFGAGCQQKTAVTVPQAVPPAALKTTILVSTEDSTTYCNGEVMDSEGYRKTITKETEVPVVATGASADDFAKFIAVSATTGQCQEALRQIPNFKVSSDAVTIPPMEGWAGISIALCRCKPEVEVNLLQLPGIKKVIWQ